MGRENLETYIQSIQSKNGTTPALIGEDDILEILSIISWNQILWYEDLASIKMSSIFIYDIPEDKKEFNIETARKCITDMELRPYEWKNIFVLRHFDTATIQAQNALLKALEECPEYAILLLEVANTHAILETIQSRTINLVKEYKNYEISPELQAIIDAYAVGDKKKLWSLLYWLKIDSNGAIVILQGVSQYLPECKIDECIKAIEVLSITHENPRTILDIFFL